jgi:hypothetical protein
VTSVSLFTDDFANAAAMAGLRARRIALANGHPVVFVDDSGRYVEELPNGRRLEIRLQSGMPRDSHVCVVGELPTPAA